MNDIPAEENLAYSNLFVKNSLSDKISMTDISFERSMSYSSHNNVQKTFYNGVIQERVCDTADEEPCKQLVLVKIMHQLN